MLRSSARGWGYGAAIAILYWLLFGILRSEDFALLMGCLLLFVILAAFMVFTRDIDWFVTGERLERHFTRARDQRAVESQVGTEPT